MADLWTSTYRGTHTLMHGHSDKYKLVDTYPLIFTHSYKNPPKYMYTSRATQPYIYIRRFLKQRRYIFRELEAMCERFIMLSKTQRNTDCWQYVTASSIDHKLQRITNTKPTTQIPLQGYSWKKIINSNSTSINQVISEEITVSISVTEKLHHITFT